MPGSYPTETATLVAAGPRERDDAGVQKTSERPSLAPPPLTDSLKTVDKALQTKGHTT